MSEIFDSTTLAPTERLIMLALADHASDDGVCWPSIARLTQKTGLGERAVQANIRKLRDAGYITIEDGGGRSKTNKYVIRAKPVCEGKGAYKTPFPAKINPASDDTNPAYGYVNPAADAPEPLLTIMETPREPSSARRVKTAIHEDAILSDRMIADASARGIPLRQAELQFEQFKNRALSNGQKYIDWDAAWRTWLGSPYYKHINEAGGVSQGRQNRSDPALENILRIVGLGQAPGDGRA